MRRASQLNILSSEFWERLPKLTRGPHSHVDRDVHVALLLVHVPDAQPKVPARRGRGRGRRGARRAGAYASGARQEAARKQPCGQSRVEAGSQPVSRGHTTQSLGWGSRRSSASRPPPPPPSASPPAPWPARHCPSTQRSCRQREDGRAVGRSWGETVGEGGCRARPARCGRGVAKPANNMCSQPSVPALRKE